MTDLVQKNIIIVLGDLGAGTNFVKNILLLSPQVDFPWNADCSRLEFIQQSVYPNVLKTTTDSWVNFEYKLRSWQQFYGADIADNYQDINTEQVRQISQHSKIVFMCHWPDIVIKLKTKYPDIKIVSLWAEDRQDIEWQVSQYISKVGPARLQNFSFESNVAEQKQNYIQNFGQENYIQFNALNMLEILEHRKNDYYSADYITIKISQLQSTQWIKPVVDRLGLSVDLTQAGKLSDTWRNLNPPHIEYWKVTK